MKREDTEMQPLDRNPPVTGHRVFGFEGLGNVYLDLRAWGIFFKSFLLAGRWPVWRDALIGLRYETIVCA